MKYFHNNDIGTETCTFFFIERIKLLHRKAISSLMSKLRLRGDFGTLTLTYTHILKQV